MRRGEFRRVHYHGRSVLPLGDVGPTLTPQSTQTGSSATQPASETQSNVSIPGSSVPWFVVTGVGLCASSYGAGAKAFGSPSGWATALAIVGGLAAAVGVAMLQSQLSAPAAPAGASTPPSGVGRIGASPIPTPPTRVVYLR